MKNTIDSVALPACSSEKELGRVTAAWSLSRLVAVWNQLEGVSRRRVHGPQDRRGAALEGGASTDATGEPGARHGPHGRERGRK